MAWFLTFFYNSTKVDNVHSQGQDKQAVCDKHQAKVYILRIVKRKTRTHTHKKKSTVKPHNGTLIQTLEKKQSCGKYFRTTWLS